MIDAETIAVYDAQVERYAAAFTNTTPDRDLTRFMDTLPPGGTVLDLGCGPGKSAALMADRGFDVVAMDASARMIQRAGAHPGVTARQGAFEEVREVAAYDGIFANFSLLHAPFAELPAHLSRLARALRPGGTLHLGMKEGEGESRDDLGRRYTFVTEPILRGLVAEAGLATTFARRGEAKGLAGKVEPFVILLARKEPLP